MVRNVETGSKEIAALFDAVDQIREVVGGEHDPSRSSKKMLRDPAAGLLTDYGRKKARNYDNWRKSCIVPGVKRGRPATSSEAIYFAAFLDLVDSGWIADDNAVLHLFACGFECPDFALEVVRKSLGPAHGPELDLGDTETSQIRSLTSLAIQELSRRSEGTSTRGYAESAEANMARLMERLYRVANFGEEDDDSESPPPLEGNIEQIIGRMALDHHGRPTDTADDSFAWVADSKWKFPIDELRNYAGFSAREFSKVQLEDAGENILRLVDFVGTAAIRVLDDPLSIRPYLPIVAEMMAMMQSQLPGVYFDQKALDIATIMIAAIAVEIQK